MDLDRIWLKGPVLGQAFSEYRQCVADLYAAADEILSPMPAVGSDFQVRLGQIPPDFYVFRRNIFSTLFQSIYHLLGIESSRRRLYGTLNHLFRIWVTSADNLLDDESKLVVPLELPGQSRVMHQVVAIMLADRVLNRVLLKAVEESVISRADLGRMSDRSLQILLPSAAEEASEEGGIDERPDPEYVLFTIHRFKTGLLFQVPFLGPDLLGKDVDRQRLTACRDALEQFGLGCQLLDDIRDLAKDYLEKRQNYVLSQMHWQGRTQDVSILDDLRSTIEPTSKIHAHFPEVVRPTAERARGLLREGLRALIGLGLEINESDACGMAESMFFVLDVGDLHT